MRTDWSAGRFYKQYLWKFGLNDMLPVDALYATQNWGWCWRTAGICWYKLSETQWPIYLSIWCCCCIVQSSPWSSQQTTVSLSITMINQQTTCLRYRGTQLTLTHLSLNRTGISWVFSGRFWFPAPCLLLVLLGAAILKLVMWLKH